MVFLFVKHIAGFNLTSSLIREIFGLTLVFFIPLLLGLIFAFPFILFAKRINSKKTLRHIFYIVFILMLFFFVYSLYYYINEIEMFGFEQRLHFFANDISNPFVQFFFQILRSCLETNIQLISLMAGFMINIYRKLEI